MKKYERIQTFLQQSEVDLTFISTPDNVFYVSGFSSNPHERVLGIVVFKDVAPFIICPLMEVPDVLATGWPFEAIGYEDTEDAWAILSDEIHQRIGSPRSIAIEKSHVTVNRMEIMENLFSSTTFSQVDDLLQQMRVIKSEDECKSLRKAAELADYAIEVGCNAIMEGRTELEVLMAVEFELKKKGVQKMSFDTIVLSGPNTTSPHGVPGDRKIQRGDFILFDLGIVYNGYCSDITRTVAFGEPTAAMREIYETVRKGQQAAVDLVRPGVTARELDHAARSVITEAGYGDYFTHRLGHGLGISVHEYPSITGTSDFVLEEGMVFTIEPGIYDPKITGVRIEDDILVTRDGSEALTNFPKELKIIE